MALPASGEISLDDLRIEMGQSSYGNYSTELSAWGAWSGNGWFYSPVNITDENANDYPTTYPINFSDWYNYDHAKNYAPSDTFRDMFINYAGACYSSTMTVYDLGTTNKTYDITVSGSAADFSGVDYVRFFYGQPWNSSGTTTGSYAPVHEIYVNQSAYNQTYSYSYSYDSGRGQKLYIVATAGCY